MSLNSRYSDLSFNPKLTNEGDIAFVYDTSAINQSLFNILHTQKGRRLMDPDFGCDVHRYLFDPFDQNTVDKINGSIRFSFHKYEPRIRILSMNTKMNEDAYTYELNVKYFVEKLQTVETFSASLQKL